MRGWVLLAILVSVVVPAGVWQERAGVAMSIAWFVLCYGIIENDMAPKAWPSAFATTRRHVSTVLAAFTILAGKVDAQDGRAAPADPVRETSACVLLRIVDGDTVRCRMAGREIKVRFIGMDTPEMSQGTAGQRASDALSGLIAVGDTVQLEPDAQAQDRYGRTLAYLWRRGRMLNWEMVREGWAVSYSVPPNVQYGERFIEAERAAREEGKGLWTSAAFACAPADYRRGRC
jgi:micrococcal nuclease